MPKCSLACFKTGIITSDDFSWCVSKAEEGFIALIRPVANCDFNHNVGHGNATTAKV